MSFEHVSDTALLVAACRAMETELEDGFVRDPFAARLAGERGPIMAHEVNASKWLAFGVGIRSHFIDDLLLEVIGKGEIDTVLNVGAGLDTRPWRLDLPASVRWIEADFPDVLDYKAEKLEGETPRCRRETLGVDLTDDTERRKVLAAAAGPRSLIMTEGLLTYLPGDSVRALAEESRGFRYWLLDVISNFLMTAVPGRNWTPFANVRSSTAMKGEEILEMAQGLDWEPAAKRRNLVEGLQVGYARIVRLTQEAAARGETIRRDPLPPNDVSGVWLLGHK
jgi:O-methyltransferase involved in polyketide biosynthesis